MTPQRVYPGLSGFQVDSKILPKKEKNKFLVYEKRKILGSFFKSHWFLIGFENSSYESYKNMSSIIESVYNFQTRDFICKMIIVIMETLATQYTFTCSKLAVETLEARVK